MWFVGLGVLLLVMNLANIGPVGAWTWEDDWWLMLAPFGLAVVWWAWADATGWNKRRAMEKIDARREERPLPSECARKRIVYLVRFASPRVRLSPASGR